MKEPPVMVSTKDSMHTCDILNVIYTFIKKFEHYNYEIQDEKITNFVITATDELTNQYTELMEVFNEQQ